MGASARRVLIAQERQRTLEAGARLGQPALVLVYHSQVGEYAGHAGLITHRFEGVEGCLMTPPRCTQIAQLALNESQIVQRLGQFRRRVRTLQQANSSFLRLMGIGELASALVGESQGVEQPGLGHGVAGGFGQCARLGQKGHPLLQVAGIQISLGHLSQLLVVPAGWVSHRGRPCFPTSAGSSFQLSTLFLQASHGFLVADESQSLQHGQRGLAHFSGAIRLRHLPEEIY